MTYENLTEKQKRFVDKYITHLTLPSQQNKQDIQKRLHEVKGNDC